MKATARESIYSIIVTRKYWDKNGYYEICKKEENVSVYTVLLKSQGYSRHKQ